MGISRLAKPTGYRTSARLAQYLILGAVGNAKEFLESLAKDTIR